MEKYLKPPGTQDVSKDESFSSLVIVDLYGQENDGTFSPVA